MGKDRRGRRTTPIVELRGVEKHYIMGEEVVKALRGVSLDIHPGEFIAIFGPSGSGKSTLLHILGLLDRPTKGRVILKGKDVTNLTEDERAPIRMREIGFVFQTFNLIPALTALENVELPMALAGIPKEKRRERAKALLTKLGLGDRLNHKPSQLSGGQRQRVAIARALANKPSIILADEPTGNLDSKSGKEVMDIFQALNREGTTIVVVTHDAFVRDYARRILYIRDGLIEKEVVR